MWSALRVEVMRKDKLTLPYLLCNARSKCTIGRQVAEAGVALHLDKPASDGTAGDVEIENGEVRSSKAHLVTEFVSLRLQDPVKLKVGVEWYDDLILENALMLKI